MIITRYQPSHHSCHDLPQQLGLVGCVRDLVVEGSSVGLAEVSHSLWFGSWLKRLEGQFFLTKNFWGFNFCKYSSGGNVARPRLSCARLYTCLILIYFLTSSTSPWPSSTSPWPSSTSPWSSPTSPWPSSSSTFYHRQHRLGHPDHHHYHPLEGCPAASSSCLSSPCSHGGVCRFVPTINYLDSHNCDCIIIIFARPKPAYGQQGLAGSWDQDTDQAGFFWGVLNV